MLKISSSGTSNAGKKKINEDNFYINGTFVAENNASGGRIYSDNTQRNLQFYAVFDGLGDDIRSDLNPNIDFRDGDRAAYAAADMLSRLQRHLKTKDEYNLSEYIYRFIKKTNNNICEYMRQKKIWTGTSFSLLCINQNIAYIYNIGNSKVFLLRDNRLTLVSRNDTKAENMVMAKKIGADIAKHTPENKVLTQYLGIYENERPLDMHMNRINLKNGDKFLICSDGLYDLPHERIYQIMSRDMSEQEIITDLTNEASRGTTGENIAAVVVGVNYYDRTSSKAGLLKPTPDGTSNFGPLTFRSKFELKPKHIRHIVIAVLSLIAFIIILSFIFNVIFGSGEDEYPTDESKNPTSESQTTVQTITSETGDTANTGNVVATTPEGTSFNIPTWDENATFATTEATTRATQPNTPAPTSSPITTTEPTAETPPATTETPAVTDVNTDATTSEPAADTTPEEVQTTEEPAEETTTEAPVETEAPTETEATTEAVIVTEAPVETEAPTAPPTEEATLPPAPPPETDPPVVEEATLAEE